MSGPSAANPIEICDILTCARDDDARPRRSRDAMVVAKEQRAIDSHTVLIVETNIRTIVSGSADSMLIITRGRTAAWMGGHYGAVRCECCGVVDVTSPCDSGPSCSAGNPNMT
jgi:hypothetical protein